VRERNRTQFLDGNTHDKKQQLDRKHKKENQLQNVMTDNTYNPTLTMAMET
jgi:hypothetical protein